MANYTLLLLLLTLNGAFSIPFLHSVNHHDLRGHLCTPPSFPNQHCPQLCASSTDHCPAKPKCPPAQSYCIDGTCHPGSCPDTLTSPCACDDPGSLYSTWFPCPGSVVVDLVHIIPSNKSLATVAACQSTVSANVFLEFVACPVLPDPVFSLDLGLWILLFSFLVVHVLIVAAFYRTRILSRHMDAALDSAKTAKNLVDLFRHDSFLDTHTLLHKRDHTPNLTFTYYKNHRLGTFTFYCSVLWILVTQLTLALIVFDYYVTLDGAPPLFLDNITQIPYAFVLVWHLMVFTLLVWKLAGFVRIRNWCRIPVSHVNQAQFVVIARKSTPPTPSTRESGILRSLFSLIASIDRFADRFLDVNTCRSQQSIQVSIHLMVPFFYFECVRYVYSPITRDFSNYPYSLGDSVSSIVGLAARAHATGGLGSDCIDQRMDLVGLNEIDIPSKSFLALWLSELSGWFYLYQGSCLWIWYPLHYQFLYFNVLLFVLANGLVLTFVILVASIVKTNVSFKSHRRIRDLAAISTHVSIYRNSAWTLVDSRHLVPGDILQIQPGVLSTDILLIQGQTLLDESSLTGESRPIRKFPATTDPSPIDSVHHKRHILLAGTMVLQADLGSYGIVLKTNVNTSRGLMIQKMLHPKPIKFVFDEQLKVILLLMLTWGIVCFSLVLYFMGPASVSSWFYAMFIISEVISPLLPAVLVAGQSVAAERLVRNHSIYCIDLPRITMAGKVQIVCFDKTGTLTKEGLDIWGYLPASTLVENAGHLPDLITDYDSLEVLAQQGLAAAHSVSSHNEQLVGNPVDVSMFEFTGCSITGNQIASSNGADIGHIVKRWEFVHAKQTMATLVETSSSLPLTVFVKGSYERVRAMCADSVPDWYDSVACAYAKRGGYVLALASKPCAMPTHLAVHQPREDVECDLTLLGLVVFRNALKPDSRTAVRELQAGECRTVMISGDNVFTCVCIARECGITPEQSNDKYARCLYGDVRSETNDEGCDVEHDPNPHIVWRDIDTEEIIPKDEFSKIWRQRNIHPLDLAVTGAAWTVLMAENMADQYLLSIRVWGRMSPEQKVQVVQRHMKYNAVTVAMVGDGGNDCGALNAAHVGIALSETEASIVAPFSSKTKSVQSVVHLIAEGRAALATSFSGFKFLMMYGLTMSSFCLVQYYFSVILPQLIWIYIDGIIVVSSIYALTQSKPLANLQPRRPTAQLLGPQTLLSILIQTVINWSYLFFGIYWLFQQPWFRCHEFDSSAVDAAKWWLMGDNYESTIISVIVVHQFINNGAVFNFGHYYRQSWATNRFYVALYLTLMLMIGSVLLTGPNWFTCLFRINCGNTEQDLVAGRFLLSSPSALIEVYNNPWGHNILPQSFRWELWAYVLSNVALGLIAERLFVVGPVREWARNMWPLVRQHIPL